MHAFTRFIKLKAINGQKRGTDVMHPVRGYIKKARSNLLGHVLIIIWHISYKYSKKEIRINSSPMTILKHDPLS